MRFGSTPDSRDVHGDASRPQPVTGASDPVVPGDPADIRDNSPLPPKEKAEYLAKGDVLRERYSKAIAAEMGLEVRRLAHSDGSGYHGAETAYCHPNGANKRYSRVDLTEGWSLKVLEEDSRTRYRVEVFNPDRGIDREKSRSYTQADLELLVEKHVEKAGSPAERKEALIRDVQKLPAGELVEHFDRSDLLLFSRDPDRHQKYNVLLDEMVRRFDSILTQAWEQDPKVIRAAALELIDTVSRKFHPLNPQKLTLLAVRVGLMITPEAQLRQVVEGLCGAGPNSKTPPKASAYLKARMVSQIVHILPKVGEPAPDET